MTGLSSFDDWTMQLTVVLGCVHVIVGEDPAFITVHLRETFMQKHVDNCLPGKPARDHLGTQPATSRDLMGKFTITLA